MAYINPAPLKRDGYSTPEMKRIYTLLLKFIKYPMKNFHEWTCRPNAGYFFSGCYWYGQIDCMMIGLLAFLAKYGEYDEGIAGISRKTVLETAIKCLRYACFTHDTGPEDCVRADGKNKLQANTKWGGNYCTSDTPHDRFFQGTQVGGRMVHLAYGAWFLWDELDEETRQMVYNVITDYAERWCTYEPKTGVYDDTQTEENGWTALGISAAAYIFHDDPRAEKWKEAALRWMLDSTNRSLDLFSEEILPDGRPLRSVIGHLTLHPDFTAENHGFVHPVYMNTPFEYRITMGLFSMLSGAGEFPGLRHNLKNIYDSTFRYWSADDGGMLPIQSQDWFYYRIENYLSAHTMMRLLYDDPYAAYLEERCFETFEKTQAGHPNGTFIDNEPEKCVLNPTQAMDEFEPTLAVFLVNIYLWHMCLGSGIAAVTREEFEKGTAAVKNYPFGGTAIQRTVDSFSCFSYRNKGVLAVFPKDNLWTITVPPSSTFGKLQFADDCKGRRGISNQAIIHEMKDVQIYDERDSYSASAWIDRGYGRIRQNVAFVSLPDGRGVYFQRVKAMEDCVISSFTSGLTGIRNELYTHLGNRAKGYRDLYINDAVPERMRGYIGGEDIVHDFSDVKYAAVDDKISYLLYGSGSVRYTEHHNYPSWKGIEDFLVLNQYENITLHAGESLPRFILVYLPNRDITEAAAAYKNATVSEEGGMDAVILDDILVWSIYGNDIPKSADFVWDKGEVPLFEGVCSLKNGKYSWTCRVKPKDGGYRVAAKKIRSDRDFDAVVLPDGEILIRYEGESSYIVL